MIAKHTNATPRTGSETTREKLAKRVTVIEPATRASPVDWSALWEYRGLFLQFTWRHIRARYAQSVIGIGWAVLQPLATMVVFSLVFGTVIGVKSDGAAYPLFSFVALVPWAYFSNALSGATASLIGDADMLRKIYFPRLLLPLSLIAARLVDFAIATAILAILLAVYRVVPTTGSLVIPLLVVIMVISATGLGLWFTALAVQYRDVNYSINLILQIGMYASPVIYPASMISGPFQLLYALNPMVGVIEGFRACLLGTRPVPWDFIAVGSLVACALFMTGLRYFQSREHVFADVA